MIVLLSYVGQTFIPFLFDFHSFFKFF